MDAELLKALNEERGKRRAVVLAVDLDGGQSRMIREGESLEGELAEAVEQAVRQGKSAPVELEGKQFFLNVYVPSARIVAVGASHIAQALSAMAKIAGFSVEIVDPRTAFATKERFPDALLFPEWPEEAFERRPLDSWTALVALSHDPKIDDLPLIEALKAKCFYVGALGSRKTHAKRKERLIQAGVGEAQIDSIAAPVGLDIGASSPAEIAIAILAQIVSSLRKGERNPSP